LIGPGAVFGVSTEDCAFEVIETVPVLLRLRVPFASVMKTNLPSGEISVISPAQPSLACAIMPSAGTSPVAVLGSSTSRSPTGILPGCVMVDASFSSCFSGSSPFGSVTTAYWPLGLTKV
jgi:hypothetical protein